MIPLIGLCIAAGLLGAKARSIGSRLQGRARRVAMAAMLWIVAVTTIAVLAMAWALANALKTVGAEGPELRAIELERWTSFGNRAFLAGVAGLAVAATALLLLWTRHRRSRPVPP